jgi:DNA-binding FadR family transcriptional regulator
MAKRLLAYEAIAQEIQDVILAGGFRPGSRMPDESELAVRYGVGRSTIREALRLLGGRGYVRIAAGSGGGAFVNTGDATAVGRGFGDDLAFLMGGEAISVGELGEARRVQEVSSVRLAARRAGPAEIERIQQLAHDALTLLDDSDQFLRVNLDFHLLISEATHNRVLHMWMSAIRHVLESAMRDATSQVSLRRHVGEQHIEIADAIARHDENEAAALMRVHLDDFCIDWAMTRSTSTTTSRAAARQRTRHRHPDVG